MKLLTSLFISLVLLFIGSTSYVQGSVFHTDTSAPAEVNPAVKMAVVSPAPDTTVNGDFFVTGVANNEKEGVKKIDVSFASLYDKTQTPVRAYTATYSQGKWSTHVKEGELPNDVYAVMVTVHTDKGNKQYLFSTVVVDSSTSSQITTL